MEGSGWLRGLGLGHVAITRGWSVAVKQKLPETSLAFLNADPVPVEPGEAAPEPARTLPSGVVDELMRLDGVDGVWVEQDPRGAPVVILHYSHPGSASHLPTRVLGMPIRVVGGEPIRAY